MELGEIIREINATRGPVGSHQVLDKRGVYALFVKEDLHMKGFLLSGKRCIYVGFSKNLAERAHENHFATGSTGFSTVRRSLGALLKKEMRLRAMPRNRGGSETSFRNYRFNPTGEERLTKWMRTNLEIGFCSVQDNPREVERALLSELNPALNLKGVQHPLRQRIMELRKACATEARSYQIV
jgi:hypothetical protein